MELSQIIADFNDILTLLYDCLPHVIPIVISFFSIVFSIKFLIGFLLRM